MELYKQPLEYRLATKADIPQLIALLNSHYIRKKDAAYFQWQFFNTYYPTICMCAFAKNQLVGMFGLQKRVLNNGVVVGHLIDLLTAPEFRNRHIFKTMGQLAFEQFPDLKALSVLPNGHGKKACEKAFGFRTIAKIDDLVLTGRPSLVNSPTEQNGLIRFWNTRAFRSWRYDRNPIYKYNLTEISSEIFTVTKIFVDPGDDNCFGDIVDFNNMDDNLQPVPTSQPFYKAMENLSKNNVSGITTWALPHTSRHDMLHQMGFREIPRERYFCIKVIDSALEYLYDIRKWDLVQADAELY